MAISRTVERIKTFNRQFFVIFLVAMMVNGSMLAFVNMSRTEPPIAAPKTIVTIKERIFKAEDHAPKSTNFGSLMRHSSQANAEDEASNDFDVISTTRRVDEQNHLATVDEVISDLFALRKGHHAGYHETTSSLTSLRLLKPLIDDASYNSEPIYINGDADFAAQAEVNNWQGDGTADNPYIIENLAIEVLAGSGDDNAGIHIANTTVHFIIRNMTVMRGNFNPVLSASTHEKTTGVHLVNVTNGVITNMTLASLDMGLIMENSRNVLVSESLLQDMIMEGFRIENCTNVTVRGSQFSTQSDFRFFLDSSFRVSQSRNITILDNVVASNADYGMIITNTSDFTIMRNLIQNTVIDGLVIFSSPNGRILQNTLVNTGMRVIAFKLENVIQSEVKNNTVNGKPLVFIQNKAGEVVDEPAGQIILINSSSVQVRNQVIGNTSTGITLLYSRNITLERNAVINVTNYGYMVVNSDDTVMMKNIAAKARGAGFLLSNVNNLHVLGNEAWESFFGLITYNGTSLFFENNTMRMNDLGMLIKITSNTVSLIDNQVVDNAWDGVRIEHSENILMHGNVADENDVGIRFVNVSLIALDDNVVSNNRGVGVLLEENDAKAQAFLTGNQILRNDYGIYVKSATRIIARDNSIGSNIFDGIVLDSGASNSIYENNTIFDNDDGLVIMGLGTNGTFIYNTFFFNRRYGINLPSSTSQYQILKNNFLENNLVKGQTQAYSGSITNYFAQNFWSRFVAPDEDGDGIVDYPHPVEGPGNNADLEPVASPHPNPLIAWPARQLLITIPKKEHVFNYEDNSMAGEIFSLLLFWDVSSNNPVINLVARNDSIIDSQVVLHPETVKFHDSFRFPSVTTIYNYHITVIDVFGQQSTAEIIVTIIIGSETNIDEDDQGSMLDFRISGFSGFTLLASLGVLAIIMKKLKRNKKQGA